jgi:hypothetical protein
MRTSQTTAPCIAIRHALLICSLLLCAAHPVHADWWEVKSADVDIVSRLSRSQTVEVAQALADYRAAIGHLMPALDQRPNPPVVLFLMPETTDDPLPLPGDLCQGCSGETISREHVTYIIDHPAAGTGTVTALHEFTHKLLRQAYRGVLPVWFDEGLAELLSTVRRSQGHLVIGQPPRQRWHDLQILPWLPLAGVLRVTHESPEYTSESTSARAFYAQSWLLAHYTRLASPVRLRQVSTYLDLVRKGMAIDEAAAKAFPGGIAALEAELRNYARQQQLQTMQVEIPPVDTVTEDGLKTLTAVQGGERYAAMLLDVSRRSDFVPPAALEKFVRELALPNPADPVAQLLLANIDEAEGRSDLARPLLARSCVKPLPSADIAVLCGDASMRRARRASDRQPALSGRIAARSYYEAAARLAPDDLKTWTRVAETYIDLQGNSAQVRARLEQYLAAAPANYYIARQLAALYRPVNLKRAKAYADGVVRDAHDPGEQEVARNAAREIDAEIAARAAAH